MIFEGRAPLKFENDYRYSPKKEGVRGAETNQSDNNNTKEGLSKIGKLTIVGSALATAIGGGFALNKNSEIQIDSVEAAEQISSKIKLPEEKPEFQSDNHTENAANTYDGKPIFIELPAYREITEIQKQLEKEIPFYGENRKEVTRTVPTRAEVLQAPHIPYRHLVNKPAFDDVKPFGRETVYGNESMGWRRIEALKYKTLTSAVERRYNLPPDLISAMITQESGGKEFLPNSIGDGGFGLSHMQGCVAEQYGLRTPCHSLICNGTNKSCKDGDGNFLNHGKTIKDKIEAEKNRAYSENYDFRETLANFDERLNHLANIDAVGRILFKAILDWNPNNRRTGNPEIDNDPLKSAICVYTGTHNFPTYWANIQKYVKDLDDIDSLRKIWNQKEKTDTTLDTYLYKMQHFNAINYGVAEYIKLPCYMSTKTQLIANTFKSILPSHTEQFFFCVEKTHDVVQGTLKSDTAKIAKEKPKS